MGTVGALHQSQDLTVEELRKVNALLDGAFSGPLGEPARDHGARTANLEGEVDALERKRARALVAMGSPRGTSVGRYTTPSAPVSIT